MEKPEFQDENVVLWILIVLSPNSLPHLLINAEFPESLNRTFEDKLEINFKITFHIQDFKAFCRVVVYPVAFWPCHEEIPLAFTLSYCSLIPFELFRICCVWSSQVFIFSLNPSSSWRGRLLPSWLRLRQTTSSARRPSRHWTKVESGRRRLERSSGWQPKTTTARLRIKRARRRRRRMKSWT